MQVTGAGNGSGIYTAQTGEDRSTLDKDDFLKLLVTELQYQDPSKPMEDREFISQMAQFSSLEQMQNMSTALESGFKNFADVQSQCLEGLAVISAQINANSFFQGLDLLGKEVTYIKDEEEITGTVDALKQDDSGKYVLVVNDEEIPLNEVKSVR